MTDDAPEEGEAEPTDGQAESTGGPAEPTGSEQGTTEDAVEDLSWETLERRVAYTCPGFDVVHDAVRLPDGTETDYDFVDEPPAVVVLPLTGDGGVVVIEEWRQAVGRVNRGLPAGSLEPGDDDLAEAARRELAEETGYAADRVEHLVAVEPANGLAASVHHHFVAHGCTPAGSQRLDRDESIRVDTTSLADLRAAVAADEVRDGRAVLAVLYHQLVDD